MPAESAASRLLLVGDAAAASHHFFDHYYLHPDPADDFEPFFYDIPPLPSADFHFDLVRMWAMYRMCLAIAPRGGAKTTVLKIDMLKRAVTMPAYSQAYCTLVHQSALKRSGELRDQAYNNRRLNDDFSPEPEFGGPLRPSKNDASQGVELFYLRNRSSVQPISSEGRHRGMRPRRFRLDDPEHDEKISTSMVNARSYMDRLINRVIMPMVMQAGRGFDWTATHVSKRHYSWHAMSMVPSTGGGPPVSKDSRFSNWARYHIQQLRPNPETGLPESCWPHNWPVDDAERTRLNCPEGTLTIPEVRRAMGERAWLAEAQGQPGDSDDRCFPLLTEREDDFFFRFSSVDSLLETSPLQSSAIVTYRLFGPDGSIINESLLFRDLIRRGRLFATADYSFTSNSSSDYKACAVLLHDPITNILFVLDGWSEQCGKDKAIKKCLTLCDKWLVPVLHPEVIKGSVTFYNDLLDIIRTKGPDHLGLHHLPAIRALRPGPEEKVQKIESLAFRFEHLLIKFPSHARTRPFFERLFAQIEGFNPEAPDGGLEHDDEIDCVAMSKFVLKSRRARPSVATPQSDKPPLQRLAEGETYADAKHQARPLGLAIDIQNSSVSTLLSVIDSRDTEKPDAPSPI